MTLPGNTGDTGDTGDTVDTTLHPEDGESGPPPRRGRVARRVDVFLQPRNFRLRIALALAAISLVSAYVSYVAGERAGIAADLDALASQQWAEEQQVQQQIDAVVAQDQRITAYLDQDVYALGARVEDAEAARTEDPERAAQSDLGAQTAVARYAQLCALPPRRATGLDQRGRTCTTPMTPAPRPQLRLAVVPGIQRADRAEADRAAELTTYTVLVVVILVSALFLLTLAHVAGGRRGLWLASLGAASALGGIVYFATLDLAAALPILVGATAVAFALIATRIPRVHRWLEGMERDDIVGDVAAVPTRPGATASTNPSDPPTSRFTRYIAIAIAVATLLGAGVGYLHGRASSSSDDEAWRARDLGVEAIGALRSAEEALAVQIDSYQLALSAHVDAWDAAQRASYAAWSGDTAEADRMTREAGKFDELAQRHEERSELADDLGSAGVSSEALRDVRAEVWEASARLAALQDAANAASRAWGARAGAYLSVLAWLAVAAYLLGLSLIFRDRRVRQVLASVGTVLILAAAARSGMALAEPVPASGTQAAAAAKAYAAGFVAQARQDPVEAEEQFATAIEERPEFGLAHRERAHALMQAGSAPGLGLRAAFTEHAVNEAIAELEAARENRADSAGVFLNLGAMLFHRSIQTGLDGRHGGEPGVYPRRVGSRRGLRGGTRRAPCQPAHRRDEPGPGVARDRRRVGCGERVPFGRRAGRSVAA